MDINLTAMVCVDHAEEITDGNSVLDQTLVDFIEGFFL
jgi:hypothetical protein